MILRESIQHIVFGFVYADLGFTRCFDMLKKVLSIAFAFMIPATAVAGSFDETGVYSSNVGYKIRPPEGWMRVDASTVDALKGHIPENISTSALDRFDVVFFPKHKDMVDTSKQADDARIAENKARLEADPKTAPEELTPPIVDTSVPESFVPTISILALEHVPESQEPEYAKAYAETIVEEMKATASYAEGFKVLSATRDALTPSDAFVFNIEFRSGERMLLVEQYVLFASSHTYVVTCTQDSNEYIGDKKWCRKAVESMKLR